MAIRTFTKYLEASPTRKDDEADLIKYLTLVVNLGKKLKPSLNEGFMNDSLCWVDYTWAETMCYVLAQHGVTEETRSIYEMLYYGIRTRDRTWVVPLNIVHTMNGIASHIAQLREMEKSLSNRKEALISARDHGRSVYQVLSGSDFLRAKVIPFSWESMLYDYSGDFRERAEQALDLMAFFRQEIDRLYELGVAILAERCGKDANAYEAFKHEVDPDGALAELYDKFSNLFGATDWASEYVEQHVINERWDEYNPVMAESRDALLIATLFAYLNCAMDGLGRTKSKNA